MYHSLLTVRTFQQLHTPNTHTHTHTHTYSHTHIHTHTHTHARTHTHTHTHTVQTKSPECAALCPVLITTHVQSLFLFSWLLCTSSSITPLSLALSLSVSCFCFHAVSLFSVDFLLLPQSIRFLDISRNSHCDCCHSPSSFVSSSLSFRLYNVRSLTY